MDTVLKALRGYNQKQIRGLEEKIKNARQIRTLLGRLRNPDKLTYQIRLESLWSKEGEKGLMYTDTGPLEKIIVAAEAEFMRMNGRSDVQAQYFVGVLLGDGLDLPLERDTWEHLCQKRKTS